MTGWSSITFERTEPWEDEQGEYIMPGREILDIVEEYVNEDPTNIWGLTGHYISGTVFAELCGPADTGYREWDEDREVLERTAEYWDRAVVIQANDTSDTGAARIYTANDSGTSVVKIGDFEEQEDKHGRPVGEFAAMKVYEEHDLPCRGDYNKPFQPNKLGTNRDEEEQVETVKAVEGLGGCEQCGAAIVGEMESYIEAGDEVYCDIDCYNEALAP